MGTERGEGPDLLHPWRLSGCSRAEVIAQACLLSTFPISVHGAQKSGPSLSAPALHDLDLPAFIPVPYRSLTLSANEHAIYICPWV